jgi:2-oxoglutarate ferredoxin oxidoreductase subunit beta
MTENNVTVRYKKKDFQSDTSIKWCPGCGDYSIYNAVVNAFTKLNILRENFLVVSGIGCSSRFPYYCQTYGFHTLHGRAPTIAMGAKIVNPELSVWIVTGDGDALSIGGNHFIHIIRKNPDIKILLFNNEIYGLTKGQPSPTSKTGIVTKSSPTGSIDSPINPIPLALIMGATFLARVVATDTKHMQNVIVEAGKHKGIAVVEILTNCIIFNDDAFYPFETKSIRNDNIIFLENNQPLIYGKNHDKGLSLKNMNIVSTNDIDNKDLLITHNTNDQHYTLQFLLANLQHPDFPLPIGIFRQIQSLTYNESLELHKNKAIARAKIKTIYELVNSGDTWTVN